MKRSVKILWRVFGGCLLLFVLILLCANFGVFGKMPSLQKLENPEADLASEVYSVDGKLMGKYYAENRSEVKYNEISPNVIHALVATEDVRFEEHSGIDAKAIARAVFTLGLQGGGSTITQQLAKMMLKQGHGNIVTRSIQKLKEWIVAVKLERNFTKEEIITLYLNRAAWGSNYGIRNASRTYFQKEPKDLNITESAVLVGMLKGFIYDPVRHPEKAFARKNTVIDQMKVASYLTEAEADKLKKDTIDISKYRKLDEDMGIAPYFRMVLGDKLRDWCKTHKNPKAGENYDLYRDGLHIYTTINSVMQQYAEESVEQHMPVIQKKLNYLLKYNGDKMWKDHENIIEAAMRMSERWKNMKEDGISEDVIRKSFDVTTPMKVFAWNKSHDIDTVMTPHDSIRYQKQLLQTSFVAMDPRTGEVKCWVGGIDFKWFKFDHVTAERQVGSTFKPLLYTLAVQDAGYTPDTYIPGGPLTLGGKTISTAGGAMTYCLAKSLNGAAWHLMGTIGPKRTVEFARQCGIKAPLQPYPSLALGAAEIPMLEMLRAYTMFPNKGYNTEPLMITRIEDKDGNLLQQFTSETKQVISEADAYTMVRMMKEVVLSGTARSLNNYNIPADKAGKTGTTNDNTDGWFIGYTPELLAGTWVGCDDPFLRIYTGTSGGNEMALPKWGYFMNKVYGSSKLGYGKMPKFIEPVQLMNNTLYSDENMNRYAMQGDTAHNQNDQGSGNADDYATPDDNNTEIANPSTTEDVKQTPKKTEEKKEVKPSATTSPALDEKNKKPATKTEKPKDDGGY
ncbi:transglycosylase domain-containing protein [Ferruginibacter albus]|uniref:transglycosylase domain-containing protein n=1 Tax=Ferruginibacter albus TaxID=2875540 RepID=UPI001CC55C77|nr:transglycosylase domain-containing protein [Ferruginibacter albus]UAY51487.1 transglycosylase domain-containing protein [Ferruginibacter albus]